eukprot:scaffold8271_cov171-Amphora_coffeaeformis.AAC.14
MHHGTPRLPLPHHVDGPETVKGCRCGGGARNCPHATKPCQTITNGHGTKRQGRDGTINQFQRFQVQGIRPTPIGPCHKVHQGNELGKITKPNGRMGNNVVPNNDTLDNTSTTLHLIY